MKIFFLCILYSIFMICIFCFIHYEQSILYEIIETILITHIIIALVERGK